MMDEVTSNSCFKELSLTVLDDRIGHPHWLQTELFLPPGKTNLQFE
jgi:hypothetical protein